MKRIYRFVHIVAVLALLFAVLPAALPSVVAVQAQSETLGLSVSNITLLRDIYPYNQSSIAVDLDGRYEPATPLLNNVVFLAEYPNLGIEPWITDGTSQGTKLIKDTFPGANGVYKDKYNIPVSPVTWNEKVFFVGQVKNANGNFVPQLWVTNGTAAGTSAVVTMALPPKQLKAGPNGVVFLTYDESDVRQYTVGVWLTDGTPQGTRQLYNYNLMSSNETITVDQLGGYVYIAINGKKLLKIDPVSKEITELATSVGRIAGVANGLVFFERINSTHGFELWQTNGSVNGTVLIVDLSPGTRSTTFEETLAYGSKLAFIATVETESGRLRGVYTTTGKAGGIVVLDSSSTDSYSGLSERLGTVFFIRGSKLWYSTSPSLKKQVCPSCLGVPKPGVGGGPGNYVFPAVDAAGKELWVTDLTDSGTHRASDISNGSSSQGLNLKHIITMDGYVFFISQIYELGNEPYVYRTTQQTRMTAVTDNVTAMFSVIRRFNVLANDIQLDGKPLMLTKVDNVSAKNGYAGIDNNGTPADRTDDWLVYNPHGHTDNPVDEVHYWVQDSTGKVAIGRVAITIVPLSPLPPEDIRFVPGQYPLIENTPGIENVIGNLQVIDPSPNGPSSNTCIIQTVNAPFVLQSTYPFTMGYTEPIDYESHPNGYVISVKCTDTDGLSLTKDIVIPIVNVNEPPELTVPADLTMAEDSPQQELGQVSWRDPENNTISVRPVAAYGSASLTGCAGGACTLLYQPAASFFGVDTITVKATDQGGLSTEKTITVAVTAGNDDPPVMKPLGTIVRNSGFETHQIKLEGIAAGPYETGPVTITVSTDNSAMLADLAVDYTDGPEGFLSFTLHPEEGTEALVTITLSDGVNQVDYTFNVLVTDNPPLYLPLVGR